MLDFEVRRIRVETVPHVRQNEIAMQLRRRFVQALAISFALHSGLLLAFVCSFGPARPLLAYGEMCVEIIASEASAQSPDVPGPVEPGAVPSALAVASASVPEPDEKRIEVSKTEPVLGLPPPPSNEQQIRESPLAVEPELKTPEVARVPETRVEQQATPTPNPVVPNKPPWVERVERELVKLREVVASLPLHAISVRPEATSARDNESVTKDTSSQPAPNYVERSDEAVGSKPNLGSLASEGRSEGVRTGSRLYQHAKPVYPAEARANNWSGEVVLEIDVSAEGTVSQVRIRSSSGYRVLDDSALTFARSLRFEPARQGLRAVSSTEVLPVRFRIRD
jgi:protein TonB